MDIQALLPFRSNSSTFTCNPRSYSDFVIINIDELVSFYILVLHASKKNKIEWQILKNFQNTWVANFPWAKFVVVVDGN